MTRLVIFAVATLLLAWISRNQLTRPDSHGFYRFAAWEFFLAHWVLLSGDEGWLIGPRSPLHLAAWVLIGCAVVVAVWPVYLLSRHGKPNGGREDPLLFPFEKTTELVTTNVYAYVRHPMYAGLLFSVWGLLVQKCSWPGIALAVAATTCILLAVRAEEAENVRYFGAAYETYMRRSKRFIPWLV